MRNLPEGAPSPFANIVEMTASPAAVPERSWGGGVLWQRRLSGECKLFAQSSLYKAVEGHFCFPYKCQRALISLLLFVFLWVFVCTFPLLYSSTWKSDSCFCSWLSFCPIFLVVTCFLPVSFGMLSHRIQK